MKITKIKEHIGAEVTGIDLREPLDADTRQRLNAAAAEHVALVIRDQKLSAAQYQTAAENFGSASGETYQLAFESQKMLFSGRASISQSSSPAGISMTTVFVTSTNGHFFKARTDRVGWAMYP